MQSVRYLRTRRHRLPCKNPRKKRENCARKPLMFLGAWKTEGAPRGRAGYLVALETTQWVFWSATLRMSRRQRGSCCNGGLVGPGPSRAAWSIGPGRRRFRGANGPCSFGVDALLRARSLLSVARTVMWLAGDFSPAVTRPTPTNSGALHTDSSEPDSTFHRTPNSTVLQVRLHHPSSSTPPDSNALLHSITAQPNWLLGVSARPFIGFGVVFGLSPSTLHPPAGSAPFVILIRFANHVRTWSESPSSRGRVWNHFPLSKIHRVCLRRCCLFWGCRCW